MTATVMVRLGVKKRRSRAPQRPRTQQQARRQRSRSLEGSSSEDTSDRPRMAPASAAPIGGSQSPDQAPDPSQAAQDSCVSPEAHASVLTCSSKDFAGYLMSLQMRQRCTMVA
ncbi:TPA: hypothetical protein ACH3X2_010542 [Trebouxia sp. C0005]